MNEMRAIQSGQGSGVLRTTTS